MDKPHNTQKFASHKQGKYLANIGDHANIHPFERACAEASTIRVNWHVCYVTNNILASRLVFVCLCNFSLHFFFSSQFRVNRFEENRPETNNVQCYASFRNNFIHRMNSITCWALFVCVLVRLYLDHICIHSKCMNE